MTLDATAIILAGGESRRMGRDKADLPWGNASILNYMADMLQKVCREVIVVSNIARAMESSVKVVADIIPHCGPLSGIHAGLYYSCYSHAFVVGCDMPFAAPEAVEILLEKREGYDAVIPIYSGMMEPLFAVYSKNCIPAAEHLLRAGDYRVISLYPQIRCYYMKEEQLAPPDVLQKMFQNINTPEEYRKVNKYLKGR